MSKVSIIVWHYVRDLEGSKYPAIRGRRTSEFVRQLDYISREFTVVTVEQISRAIKSGEPLPPNAAWLTFDDGYSDHFQNVFPLLHERGWQGSFFPPVSTTVNREMLDVNKIHFVLASSEPEKLVAALKDFIAERSDLEPFEHYWQLLAYEADQFDVPAVVFIKRLLQRELPESIRAEFTDRLFRKHVGVAPHAFAETLYMSEANLREMIAAGMYVGSHGSKHYWMDRLSREGQEAEIDSSLEFLRRLGAQTTDWVMCYPYGASNSSLHNVLADRGCLTGLTTRPGIADLSADRFLLSRVDTNSIPFA